MIVNFYGTYRMITGEKSVHFEDLPDLTLDDLLEQIKTLYPQLGSEMLDANGHLFPYVPIYINGRNPRLRSEGTRTLLKPEDIISIFSPVSSGSITVEAVNKLLQDHNQTEH